jgi:TrmH family RNA methyltransferase
MPPARPLTKARLTELMALRDKRKRAELGRYFVEGFHCVEEALLAAAPVEEILFAEGAAEVFAGKRIAEVAAGAKVKVTVIERLALEKLSDVESPQGVLAILRAPDPKAPLPFDRDGVHVILDGIQDPGNAGALLRAADAFGCASVVFCRGTVEPLNPKVLRAAQGSHFHLPVVTGPEAAVACAAAKAAGHRVLAAVAAGGPSLYDAVIREPRLTVVLGNEARGSPPETLAACDGRVTIPLRGRAESLGVAAAGAVVLAWFARPGGRA